MTGLQAGLTVYAIRNFRLKFVDRDQEHNRPLLNSTERLKPLATKVFTNSKIHWPLKLCGAGYESRTRTSCLGSKRTTAIRIPLFVELDEKWSRRWDSNTRLARY